MLRIISVAALALVPTVTAFSRGSAGKGGTGSQGATCVDMTFTDQYGSCATYETNGWCASGTVGNNWNFAWGSLTPGAATACCACGGGTEGQSLAAPTSATVAGHRGHLVAPSFAADMAAAMMDTNGNKNGNHLWFHFVNNQANRCGQVDAAPLMPAELFEPRNLLELAAYAEATTKFYQVRSGNVLRSTTVTVQLGRCESVGYPARGTGVSGSYSMLLASTQRGSAGGFASSAVAPWTPSVLMIPACESTCNCAWPTKIAVASSSNGRTVAGKRICGSNFGTRAETGMCKLCGSASCPKNPKGCGQQSFGIGNGVNIDLYYQACKVGAKRVGKNCIKVQKTIVDLAVATPDLSTLVAALKAASLVSTLSGTGPFTVFAPTNEAFAGLSAGVLADLLLPRNKATLAKVLTYHVVAGNVQAKDLSDNQRIKTVEGAFLTARISSNGDVFINSAKVITANVEASNGVVHIIDGVLTPPTISD